MDGGCSPRASHKRSRGTPGGGCRAERSGGRGRGRRGRAGFGSRMRAGRRLAGAGRGGAMVGVLTRGGTVMT